MFFHSFIHSICNNFLLPPFQKGKKFQRLWQSDYYCIKICVTFKTKYIFKNVYRVSNQKTFTCLGALPHSSYCYIYYVPVQNIGTNVIRQNLVLEQNPKRLVGTVFLRPESCSAVTDFEHKKNLKITIAGIQSSQTNKDNIPSTHSQKWASMCIGSLIKPVLTQKTLRKSMKSH